jgi:hypothetical protein
MFVIFEVLLPIAFVLGVGMLIGFRLGRKYG